MKVAVPHYKEEVAPCFEYSANIAIFTIRGQKVVDRMEFTLQSRESFDRVICGGVQDSFEDLLKAGGIRVISWVSGNVNELLQCFARGELLPGAKGPVYRVADSTVPAQEK